MTETSAFNWPRKGDKAFRPSVTSANRSQIEAFVMPSAGAYLFGFQRAADMVVDAAKNDDQNPDALIFPVAYLYRHHLELTLKELVRLGAHVGVIATSTECLSDSCPCCGHVTEVTRDVLSQHNLHKLWNKAKQLIDAVWPNSPDDDLKVVEQVILEFHNLDPSGQAFRYARDKDGEPHLQDAPRRIDLDNLKAAVDTISGFLDAAYGGIEYCVP